LIGRQAPKQEARGVKEKKKKKKGESGSNLENKQSVRDPSQSRNSFV
jgi:hypothetical protein